MHLMGLVRRLASRSVGLTLGFALISMLVAGCFQAAGAALEPTATGNVVPTVPATQTQAAVAPTAPPADTQVAAPTEIPTEPPTTEANPQPTLELTQAPA